ncbi:hypothetical protein [Paludibaculum fermentans]|uniref:hypothetical protein n=1 Tax=Paludibaculum fermentans TaxID=1473598 RepID=UPI003EB6DC99
MPSRFLWNSLSLLVGFAAFCPPCWPQPPSPKVTYDVVKDFNKTNASGGIFTYGVGGLPGQFTLMTKVVADFEGMPGIICSSNGGLQPYWSGILFNGSSSLYSALTIRQPPHLLRLDPQLTPGGIVRFTAPVAGQYDLDGWFESIDTNMHSTAVLVFAAGTQVFYNTLPWYSFGTQLPFSAAALMLNAGDTIDFIVKTNSNCCYLSTGLAAKISRSTSATDVTAGVKVETTGYIYSKATKYFVATVRVTNKGLSAISGPLHVAFRNLPAGITLVNKTGTFGSDPYLTLPNSTNVPAGATVSATVQFSNPGLAYINFTPAVYAGTL